MLLNFLFKKCRDSNPRPDPNGRSEPELGLLRLFSFILSKLLFMSFPFRNFIYAEAFSNSGPINIYSYTIRLQNGISCLYKIIYKTMVQSSTLLFTKYHMLKRYDMHMTGYIIIPRKFLYDSALLSLGLLSVYSKPAHR